MKKPVSVALFIAALASLAQAQSDPYSELPALDFGDAGAARAAIERQIREAGPAGYAGIETKLLAALAKPDATPACRKFACDTLRFIGSSACVAPLAKWLKDEKTADLARLTLEAIPGQAVDDELANAAKSASGQVRIGLIQTLAARRSPALDTLAPAWLQSGDPALLRVTLVALARLGSADAAALLKSAAVPADLAPLRESALVDAAFQVLRVGQAEAAAPLFEEQFRSGKSVPAVIAALQGLVDARGPAAASLLITALTDSRPPVVLAAVRASARVDGASLTQALANALPAATPAVQVALLHALAARSDNSALPAVKAALESSEEAVKAEAALALAALGDASVVNSLLALASGSGTPATAAQQTLGRLRTPGVSEALLAALDAPEENRVRAAALALRARGDAAALPKLIKLASAQSPAQRSSAFEALDGLAGAAELPALTTLLRSAPESDRDKIASALWKATRALGSDDERFLRLWTEAAAEPEPLRIAILSLGSVAGGAAPLGVVTEALGSASDAVKDAAVRTLCNWPNDRALPPLLDLAAKSPVSRQRILAARAVVRLMNDRACSWPAAQKIAALDKLLPALERAEDQKMIRAAQTKFSAKAK